MVSSVILEKSYTSEFFKNYHCACPNNECNYILICEKNVRVLLPINTIYVKNYT